MHYIIAEYLSGLWLPQSKKKKKSRKIKNKSQMVIWHQEVVPEITPWVYFVLDPVSFRTEQTPSGSGIA